MPSSYPTGYDSYTAPGATMDLAVLHSTRHTNVQDAVVAIETAVGLSPQGSDASVRARLDRIDAVPTVRCGVTARRVANQTLTATAVTVISFDTEDEDTDGFFVPTSTNLTVPAGKAGVYSITARIDCGVAKAAPAYARITVGATEFFFPTATTDILNGSITLPLAVGVVVTIAANNPGAADGSGATVWMHRVAA